MSQKRKLAAVEYLPEKKRRCQLEETSDRKRRRSAEEASCPEPKIFKEEFDFFKTRVVSTSLTSPAPACLLSPGLCHQPKLTPRTFPTNILHLLLDEKEKEEEEEVEEYEEKELNEEEFEEDVLVSFQAGSLSKRTLCLSSPGLCRSSSTITQRSFPPNIAHLLLEEKEEVEEEEDDEKENEEALVDFFEELSDDEEAFEDAVEFDRAALSPSPSLCLSPALCMCNKFTSRSLRAFASRAWSPPPKVLAMLLEEEVQEEKEEVTLDYLV